MIASSLAKGKLGKNTTVLQGTKGCRLKYKFRQQWTIVSLLSSSLYAFNVPRGSLYSFTRENEGPNPSDLKEYGRLGVEWVGSMSRKTPKGFGLCTHPVVRGYRVQTHVCTRLSGKNPRISFFIYFWGLSRKHQRIKDSPWGLKSLQWDRGRPYKVWLPGVVNSAITDAP